MFISCQVVTSTNQPLEGLMATLSSGSYVFEGCTDQFGCINLWFPQDRKFEQPQDRHWITALTDSTWRIVLATESAWSHFRYIPVEFSVTAGTHSRVRFLLNGALCNGEPDTYSIFYDIKPDHLPPIDTSDHPGILVAEKHYGIVPAQDYIPLETQMCEDTDHSLASIAQFDTQMVFSMDDDNALDGPMRGRKRKIDEQGEQMSSNKRYPRRSERLRLLRH